MPTKKDAVAVNTPVKISRPGKAAVVLSWSAVVFLMALIFYASALPARDIPPLFAFQDIVYHFCIFSFLAFAFSRASGLSWPQLSAKKIFLFAFAFAAFYGITDELHQAFTQGRSVSAWDAAIDAAGGLMGGFIYRWLS